MTPVTSTEDLPVLYAGEPGWLARYYDRVKFRVLVLGTMALLGFSLTLTLEILSEARRLWRWV